MKNSISDCSESKNKNTKLESVYQKATLSGGCFWCTEAIFQQLKGVVQVESGYSGGKIENPTYRKVISGTTAHSEVVEIKYDKFQISYRDLIKIHLTTHNPTTLKKRRATDQFSPYRSIVFYRSEAEKEVAIEVIREVQDFFDKKIVTEVKEFQIFYKASLYHQNYYETKPNSLYCQTIIDPKLEKFKRLYKEKMK